MSPRSRAPALRYRRGRPRRAGALRASLLVLTAVVMLGLVAGVASAEAPSGVIALSPAEAVRSGARIGVTRHPELDASLIEVQLPIGAPDGRLLAVAPDGATVAVADRIDLAGATLSISRPDGAVLRLTMPGLLAAAFAPDGSWLAVLDGAGSLWRVATADGSAARVATGPFLGPVTVEGAGTVLLAAVASVDAPITSRLVRVDPANRSIATLSDDQLVYGASILADGSIAIVAHEPHGTIVSRVTASGRTSLADLGPGAIHVAVSLDGGRIAWERHGDGIYLLDAAAARPRRISAGARPRFAPDAGSLLIDQGGETVLIGLDGSRLGVFPGPAAFSSCAGGCLP
jgi:hypothetical protein